MTTETPRDAIVEFWEVARSRAGLDDIAVVAGATALGSVVPPAWSFDAEPAAAEAQLAAVLDGGKTATSSALWEYEIAGAELPREGDVSIVLDSAGEPRALVQTTRVEVVAFDEVDAVRAAADGELSVEAWREARREVFTGALESSGREFARDLPVVFEFFELRYPS